MLVTSPSVRRPGTNEHEECGHNARALARWRTCEMSYKEKLALKILQLFLFCFGIICTDATC